MIRYCVPNIDHTKIDPLVITDILSSGWVSNGKWCRKLEDHFKDSCGVKYALSCSNATAGLTMAVRASEFLTKAMIIPAFTWPSTQYACVNQIMFSDINKETWLSDSPAISLNVDTFGSECSVNSKRPAIIDAAHGFGLPSLGKRGLAEVVSFSHTKLVTGMEGGMILSDDDDLASSIYRMRRMFGRMEEINAYIALTSIARYYENKDRLEEIVKTYKEKLDFPFTTQKCTHTNNSVFAIVFESTKARDAAIHALDEHDIESKVYYEPLVEGCPNTDYLFNHILALPVYVEMQKDLDFIITVLNRSQQ